MISCSGCGRKLLVGEVVRDPVTDQPFCEACVIREAGRNSRSSAGPSLHDYYEVKTRADFFQMILTVLLARSGGQASIDREEVDYTLKTYRLDENAQISDGKLISWTCKLSLK